MQKYSNSDLADIKKYSSVLAEHWWYRSMLEHIYVDPKLVCVCVCACVHEIFNICNWYKNRTCVFSVWYLINMTWMHHFFTGVHPSVLLSFAKWSNRSSLIEKMNNLDKLEINHEIINDSFTHWITLVALNCIKARLTVGVSVFKPVWRIFLITFTLEVKCNKQKSGVWWCLRGRSVLTLIENEHHNFKFSSTFKFYNVFVYLFSRRIA